MKLLRFLVTLLILVPIAPFIAIYQLFKNHQRIDKLTTLKTQGNSVKTPQDLATEFYKINNEYIQAEQQLIEYLSQFTDFNLVNKELGKIAISLGYLYLGDSLKCINSEGIPTFQQQIHPTEKLIKLIRTKTY